MADLALPAARSLTAAGRSLMTDIDIAAVYPVATLATCLSALPAGHLILTSLV